MKNRIHRIWPCLTALVFISCSTSAPLEPDPPIETSGLMQVRITQENGLAEDKMKTVRFIVFDYGNNRLEINRLFYIPDPSSGDEVSQFDMVLEVRKRSVAVNAKMVVVILNEPEELSPVLSSVTNYTQVIGMGLDLGCFLNTEHTALETDRLMPMTGVTVTDKIYETEPQAFADPVRLSVNRAVARVDIYLNKEAGLDIELAPGTQISLDNTYHHQFLVRHLEGSHVYGNLQTVSSGWMTKSWQLQPSDSPALPVKTSESNGRLACSFYTPERTCTAAGNADKLVINLQVVTDEGATRSGTVTIDRFNRAGIDTDVTEITRNNRYAVIATVLANGLTSKVLDWNTEDIHTEL